MLAPPRNFNMRIPKFTYCPLRDRGGKFFYIYFNKICSQSGKDENRILAIHKHKKIFFADSLKMLKNEKKFFSCGKIFFCLKKFFLNFFNFFFSPKKKLKDMPPCGGNHKKRSFLSFERIRQNAFLTIS